MRKPSSRGEFFNSGSLATESRNRFTASIACVSRDSAGPAVLGLGAAQIGLGLRLLGFMPFGLGDLSLSGFVATRPLRVNKAPRRADDAGKKCQQHQARRNHLPSVSLHELSETDSSRSAGRRRRPRC